MQPNNNKSSCTSNQDSNNSPSHIILHINSENSNSRKKQQIINQKHQDSASSQSSDEYPHITVNHRNGQVPQNQKPVQLQPGIQPYQQNADQNQHTGSQQQQKTSSLHDFKILKKIGEGAFSNVFKVQRLKDSKVYALKQVRMAKLNQKEKVNALNEVRILASVKSKNIVAFKEAFFEDNTNTLCIIMEFADGGDLYEKIQEYKKRGSYFNEYLIWKSLKQMAKALKALHHKNILHRDLKSANVFIDTENSSVKLGDLNVSKVSKQGGMLFTQTGTPYYASPEVWRDQPYNHKSDIWSLGCVIYEMTALMPPFRAQSMDELYKVVIQGNYPQIPSHYSSNLSKAIKCLLLVNPQKRPECDQIIQMCQFQIVAYKQQLKGLNPNAGNIDLNQSLMANEDNQELLQTIQLPENLKNIKNILPQKQYSDQKQPPSSIHYQPDPILENSDSEKQTADQGVQQRQNILKMQKQLQHLKQKQQTEQQTEKQRNGPSKEKQRQQKNSQVTQSNVAQDKENSIQSLQQYKSKEPVVIQKHQIQQPQKRIVSGKKSAERIKHGCESQQSSNILAHQYQSKKLHSNLPNTGALTERESTRPSKQKNAIPQSQNSNRQLSLVPPVQGQYHNLNGGNVQSQMINQPGLISGQAQIDVKQANSKNLKRSSSTKKRIPSGHPQHGQQTHNTAQPISSTQHHKKMKQILQSKIKECLQQSQGSQANKEMPVINTPKVGTQQDNKHDSVQIHAKIEQSQSQVKHPIQVQLEHSLQRPQNAQGYQREYLMKPNSINMTERSATTNPQMKRQQYYQNPQSQNQQANTNHKSQANLLPYTESQQHPMLLANQANTNSLQYLQQKKKQYQQSRVQSSKHQYRRLNHYQSELISSNLPQQNIQQNLNQKQLSMQHQQMLMMQQSHLQDNNNGAMMPQIFYQHQENNFMIVEGCTDSQTQPEEQYMVLAQSGQTSQLKRNKSSKAIYSAKSKDVQQHSNLIKNNQNAQSSGSLLHGSRQPQSAKNQMPIFLNQQHHSLQQQKQEFAMHQEGVQRSITQQDGASTEVREGVHIKPTLGTNQQIKRQQGYQGQNYKMPPLTQRASHYTHQNALPSQTQQTNLVQSLNHASQQQQQSLFKSGHQSQSVQNSNRQLYAQQQQQTASQPVDHPSDQDHDHLTKKLKKQVRLNMMKNRYQLKQNYRIGQQTSSVPQDSKQQAIPPQDLSKPHYTNNLAPQLHQQISNSQSIPALSQNPSSKNAMMVNHHHNLLAANKYSQKNQHSQSSAIQNQYKTEVIPQQYIVRASALPDNIASTERKQQTIQSQHALVAKVKQELSLKDLNENHFVTPYMAENKSEIHKFRKNTNSIQHGSQQYSNQKQDLTGGNAGIYNTQVSQNTHVVQKQQSQYQQAYTQRHSSNKVRSNQDQSNQNSLVSNGAVPIIQQQRQH